MIHFTINADTHYVYIIRCTLQILKAQTYKYTVHSAELISLAISNFWNNSPTLLHNVYNHFLKFAYFHVILFSEGIQCTHLCWNVRNINEHTILAERTAWVGWITMICVWYVRLRQRPLRTIVTHSHTVLILFKKGTKTMTACTDL
jgi:hypothetical protein